jgi:hypothetical protein
MEQSLRRLERSLSLAQAAKTASKTMDMKGTGWRLDIENPGDGGNIHIQPTNGSSPKYYYNPDDGTFTDENGVLAPSRDMAQLTSTRVWQQTIVKAMRYFPQYDGALGDEDDPSAAE